MKIHFRKHDAHQAFMDSNEARSAADALLDALGQDEFGIECDDCDDADSDVADDKGDRMKHYKRSASGKLEVRGTTAV